MPALQNWQAIGKQFLPVILGHISRRYPEMDRWDFRSILKCRAQRDIMLGACLPDSWTGL
jgi:hypothetical protein